MQNEQSVVMTPEQKKRRFRALTKEENIRTARQLAEELAAEFAQPFLPFMTDGLTDVQRRTKAARPAWSVNERSP